MAVLFTVLFFIFGIIIAIYFHFHKDVSARYDQVKGHWSPAIKFMWETNKFICICIILMTLSLILGLISFLI